jgi:hypothetical protein
MMEPVRLPRVHQTAGLLPPSGSRRSLLYSPASVGLFLSVYRLIRFGSRALAARAIISPVRRAKAWTSTGAGGVAGSKDNGSSPSCSSDEFDLFGGSIGRSPVVCGNAPSSLRGVTSRPAGGRGCQRRTNAQAAAHPVALLPYPGHAPECGLGHRPIDSGCLRG